MGSKGDDIKSSDNATPAKAIVTFCWECMGSETDPVECAALDCALYPYRTGKATAQALKDSHRVRKLAGRKGKPPEEPEGEETSLFDRPEKPKDSLF